MSNSSNRKEVKMKIIVKSIVKVLCVISVLSIWMYGTYGVCCVIITEQMSNNFVEFACIPLSMLIDILIADWAFTDENKKAKGE